MEKLKGAKRIKRGHGVAPPSKVKGVRLDDAVWAKMEEVAEREGTTRNALIARAVKIYVEDKR